VGKDKPWLIRPHTDSARADHPIASGGPSTSQEFDTVRIAKFSG
jgi:hypothetical protein